MHVYVHLYIKPIKLKLVLHDACTYVNDEEIQPAPGVCEVGLEAIRNPLEQHLYDEDVSEDFVCVLQNDLNRSPSLNVNVLKGLGERDGIRVFYSI